MKFNLVMTLAAFLTAIVLLGALCGCGLGLLLRFYLQRGA